MLADTERYRLHAGRNRPPRFKIGGTFDDGLLGPKRIIDISNAPIEWPITLNARKPAVIVCGDLIHALHVESVQAIVHHWGIHAETVRRMRRALGSRTAPLHTWLRRQYGRRLNDRRRAGGRRQRRLDSGEPVNAPRVNGLASSDSRSGERPKSVLLGW